VLIANRGRDGRHFSQQAAHFDAEPRRDRGERRVHATDADDVDENDGAPSRHPPALHGFDRWRQHVRDDDGEHEGQQDLARREQHGHRDDAPYREEDDPRRAAIPLDDDLGHGLDARLKAFGPTAGNIEKERM
jgi:hypothetical protein